MKISNSITLIYSILLLGFFSCGLQEGDGEPCHCSATVEIENENIIKGETLPEDLTCVVANRGTMSAIIQEIQSLYNLHFNTNKKLNESDEEWKDLADELYIWLGEEQIGNCGNLTTGLRLNGYDDLGESVDIEIKAKMAELIRENGQKENGPFWYKAMVTYSITMENESGHMKESDKAKYTLVLSTCNLYSSVN